MTCNEDEEDAMIVYQDIEALIDGELGIKQTDGLMNIINSTADLKYRHGRLKKQKELLKAWWHKKEN